MGSLPDWTPVNKIAIGFLYNIFLHSLMIAIGHFYKSFSFIFTGKKR